MVVGSPSFEIRSGMSVQDLKQLTAQRTQRQRVDSWEHKAYHSPRHYTAPASSSAMAGSPQRLHGTTYYTSTRPHRSRSPSASPSGSERMFVTCGGQVVSFMEGVVNMPPMDSMADSLPPL